MYKYAFPFGTHELIIVTSKLLHEDSESSLSSLIEEVRRELNHRALGSSAYRFNEAESESVIMTSYEFIKFLQLNIAWNSTLGNQFNPFLSESKVEPSVSLILDDKTISKQCSVSLDTRILRNAFIIELVNELLLKLHIDSFLIHTKDMFLARGPQVYTIGVELDTDVYFKTTLQDGALCCRFNDRHSKKSFAKKFASLDSEKKNKSAIVWHSSLLESTLIAYRINALSRLSHYRYFAEEERTSFVIIDEDNKPSEFKPQGIHSAALKQHYVECYS